MEGRVSVFDGIRQIQRLASNLAYNQINTPTTVWSPSMDTVQYRRVQVKIKRLVAGVQSMLEDLNHKMYALSGGKPVKHAVSADHVDDLSSTERGKSWLESAYTEPREHALMHSMVFQNKWNLSWVDEDGTLKWNATACRDFMGKAAEIVDLIITLVHVGSGPPLRGEEITRDQIRNGIQLRTIYLSFGQIVGIRRHSKDTNARGMDPFNVCYFPKCLTDAICYYLVVIRPLEKLVACQMYDGRAVEEYDMFLYVKHGRRMNSTQFSTTLEKLTSTYFGVGLSLQPLRHILIAFQRAFVEELRVQRGDNIGDLISSHNSQTASTHYAVEHGQPEGYTTSYLLNVQEWCDSYHDAIGLGDRTIPLVPIRFSRRRARRLGTVLSTAGSGEPSTTAEAMLPLIKELTATAYKSAMEDLKPFLREELQAINAEALQYIVAAGIPSDQPPGITSGTPEPPATRQSKSLPLRAMPQPSLPSALSEYDASRRLKRLLSSGEQPQAKRKSPDISTSLPITTPIPPVPLLPLTYADEDIDLSTTPSDVDVQIIPTPAQTTNPRDPDPPAAEPTTEPGTPSNPSIVLPTSETTEEESTTFTKFSLMSIRTRQPDALISPRAGDRVGSQAEARVISQAVDHVGAGIEGYVSSPVNPSQEVDPLTALRALRRDFVADFKSTEQQRLVQSVLARDYTIAVLPTGGGKSLAYELPPLCKGQLTIAVFPFKVLASQAAQTCRDRGVNFEHWTSTHPRSVEGKRLVLMAIETLLSHEMLQ